MGKIDSEIFDDIWYRSGRNRNHADCKQDNSYKVETKLAEDQKPAEYPNVVKQEFVTAAINLASIDERPNYITFEQATMTIKKALEFAHEADGTARLRRSQIFQEEFTKPQAQVISTIPEEEFSGYFVIDRYGFTSFSTDIPNSNGEINPTSLQVNGRNGAANHIDTKTPLNGHLHAPINGLSSKVLLPLG